MSLDIINPSGIPRDRPFMHNPGKSTSITSPRRLGRKIRAKDIRKERFPLLIFRLWPKLRRKDGPRFALAHSFTVLCLPAYGGSPFASTDSSSVRSTRTATLHRRAGRERMTSREYPNRSPLAACPTMAGHRSRPPTERFECTSMCTSTVKKMLRMGLFRTRTHTRTRRSLPLSGRRGRRPSITRSHPFDSVSGEIRAKD